MPGKAIHPRISQGSSTTTKSDELIRSDLTICGRVNRKIDGPSDSDCSSRADAGAGSTSPHSRLPSTTSCSRSMSPAIDWADRGPVDAGPAGSHNAGSKPQAHWSPNRQPPARKKPCSSVMRSSASPLFRRGPHASGVFPVAVPVATPFPMPPRP